MLLGVALVLIVLIVAHVTRPGRISMRYFRCWLFGHRYVYNGWGYFAECDHCGIGEFEEPDQPDGIINLQSIYLWLKYYVAAPLRLRTIYIKCSFCEKPEFVLGVPVGNHKECPPF